MEIKSERQVLMSVLSWNCILLSFKSLSESMALVWRGGGREKEREGRKGPQGAGPGPCLHSECMGCLTWVLKRGMPASELSHLLWAQEVVPCPAHFTAERRPFQTPSFLFPVQSLSAARPPSFWISFSFPGETGGWQEIPLVWPSQGSGTWVTWVKGRGMGKGLSLSWP